MLPEHNIITQEHAVASFFTFRDEITQKNCVNIIKMIVRFMELFKRDLSCSRILLRIDVKVRCTEKKSNSTADAEDIGTSGTYI